MIELRQPSHIDDRDAENYDAKALRSVLGSVAYQVEHVLRPTKRGARAALFPFVRFFMKCSSRDLRDGSGAYRDWFFSGNRPYFPAGSFEKGDVSMFQDGAAIMAMAARPQGPVFDAVRSIRQHMIPLVRSAITDVEMSPDEMAIYQSARVIADREGLQLNVLGTHESHLDAYAFEAALNALSQGEYGLDALGIVRFVCGAYMYFNGSVRAFNPAANSLFVLGPSDNEKVTKYLQGFDPAPLPKSAPAHGNTTAGEDVLWSKAPSRPENREALRALIALNKQVVAAYGNRLREILVLFPYAGRAKFDRKAFGIKKLTDIPQGVLKQISNPKALYLPMSVTGTSQILRNGLRYGVFGPITAFRPGPLRVRLAEPIRGKDMTFEKLHESMCRISYENVVAFRGSHRMPMVPHVPEDILKANGLPLTQVWDDPEVAAAAAKILRA
jgi:hypothetical protein